MAFRTTLKLLRKEIAAAASSSPRIISSSAGILWLLPVGAGGYYGYNSLSETIKDPWEKHKAISDGVIDPPRKAFMGEVLLYKVLPLRSLSRLWGFVNDLTLPPMLRRPLLGWYVRTFGCDMEEAFDPDLANYPNLGALFRRKLRDGARPVDAAAPIVSPADGHVIWFGEVSPEGDLEQVKGVKYSLEKFLGNDVVAPTSLDANLSTKDSSSSSSSSSSSLSSSSLLHNPQDNSLYHCLIYLAPGDYHRYHSPADWKVEERKHFPGELFSVSPGVTRWLKGLFNYNERVVYSGCWEHGFFCYAPVGATNVGSIKAYFDPSLATNLSRRRRKKKRAVEGGNDGGAADGHLVFPNPVAVGKGDPFGEFNLGSSIVLVFEAPKNFKFHLTPGQKIRYGSYLGRFEEVGSETAIVDEVAGVEAEVAAPAVMEVAVVAVMEAAAPAVMEAATPVMTERAPSFLEGATTLPTTTEAVNNNNSSNNNTTTTEAVEVLPATTDGLAIEISAVPEAPQPVQPAERDVENDAKTITAAEPATTTHPSSLVDIVTDDVLETEEMVAPKTVDVADIVTDDALETEEIVAPKTVDVADIVTDDALETEEIAAPKTLDVADDEPINSQIIIPSPPNETPVAIPLNVAESDSRVAIVA